MGYAIFVGKNVQSDHRKINCLKCIVCCIVKGNDVILGSKLFALKKDARKTSCLGHATFGQEKKGVLCHQEM